MNPLVSIIIPTYNRGHLIGQTLESIRSQTYTKWECIIVDDGSIDNTEEIISEYIGIDNRIFYYARPVNKPKGANACRNYGFELSKGDFINWFDSDDLMKTNFIQCKLGNFSQFYDCVITKSEFIDENANFIRTEKRTNLSSDLLEDFIVLKTSWYLPDPMYRREFLIGKYLFDENLQKGQDRDFHIRWLLTKPKIKFLNCFVTQYRQTIKSTSNDLSIETIYTLYKNENNRIKKLLNHGISKNTKIFLLKTQLKRYPYLWKNKKVVFKNYHLFFEIGELNLEVLKWFMRYSAAVISYNLIGKGYVFLKGN